MHEEDQPLIFTPLVRRPGVPIPDWLFGPAGVAGLPAPLHTPQGVNVAVSGSLAALLVWHLLAYWQLVAASLILGTTWVFDHPFFILLNFAVGGTWPGAPDATTVFPQTMVIDYVRVYSWQ